MSARKSPKTCETATEFADFKPTQKATLFFPPDRKKVHSPRFPDAVSATDAGPGAYVSPEHNRQGPSFSIAARPPRSLEGPESPGPGQYVRVRLKGQGKPTAVEVAAGFGNRTSPRFDSANSNAGT